MSDPVASSRAAAPAVRSTGSGAAALVEIRHVSKSYQRGEQVVPVLTDINLDIGQGDFVALMGPSGSGKSTLLNLVTEADVYPLPNMLDFADRLHGCTVFSKIDLRKGYWQIPVAAEDIKKTAISTPFGLFEFLRMPFGLRNAGSSFQRMMDRVLTGLPFAYCYLDDLRIASPDRATHFSHLRQVFGRLRDFGLVISLEKCDFCVDSFEFLGLMAAIPRCTARPRRSPAGGRHGTVHLPGAHRSYWISTLCLP